jgi:hypothetical protein
MKYKLEFEGKNGLSNSYFFIHMNFQYHLILKMVKFFNHNS